ncbi:hypothetical protein D3C73_1561700 [compost metagenome]
MKKFVAPVIRMLVTLVQPIVVSSITLLASMMMFVPSLKVKVVNAGLLLLKRAHKFYFFS